MKSSISTIGVMDIGSNSIKMVVADFPSPGSAPHILLEKSIGTRLGEGVHQDSMLKPAAIQRTLNAIQDLLALAKAHPVQHWHAVTTSAVRDAKNRLEFENAFHEKAGFKVEVITGEQEADLIYQGILSDPSILGSHSEIIAMDSGGGSAEWILGDLTGVQQRTSLDLGCVRMTERFLQGDPFTGESFQQLMDHFHKKLLPLKKEYSVKNRAMIGTGGSICTAVALEKSLSSFSSRRVHGQNITRDELLSLTHRLRHLTRAERMKLPGMPQKRGDIIVAGIALFAAALEILGATSVTVSMRGLRYGVLLQNRPRV